MSSNSTLTDFGLDFRSDQGIDIRYRLWNAHTLLPEKYVGQLENRKAYMLVINKADMGGSARAFDMFDRTRAVCGHIASLLQFMLRTVELVLAEHSAIKKDEQGQGGNEGKPYPIEMFLETVVESVESARMHQRQANVTNIRDSVLRNYFHVDPTNLSSSVALPNRRDGNAIESPLLQDAKDRDVLQYRLWILVDNHVDFPLKMQQVLQLAIAEKAKYTTATTLSVDNKALREHAKNNAGAPSAATGQFELINILRPNELWAAIDSTPAMLNALYAYVGDNTLLNERIRAEAMSTVKPLSHIENPFYLGAIFLAEQQFINVDPRIDRQQANWQLYSVSQQQANEQTKTYLHFPSRFRVLVVPSELHNMRFIHRYTPDYQRWNAQDRLLHAQLQHAQKTIASARPTSKSAQSASSAQVSARAVARKAIQSRGLVVDDPSEFGDDDDEDDAPVNVNIQLAGGAGDERRSELDQRKRALEDLLKSGTLSEQQSSIAAAKLSLAQKSVSQIYQRDNNISAAERAAVNSLVLDSRYIDPRVHVQKVAIERAQSGNLLVSTMNTMSAYYKERRAHIDQLPNLRDRVIELTKLQKEAFRAYETSCTSQLSDVSNVGCTINAFLHDAIDKQEAYFTPMLFFDAELSVFAHMMISEITTQDQIYHTHTMHLLQLALIVALFDAYRVAHSLKFNPMLCGPPEIGKSRVIEHGQARAIPGTVNVTGRWTANAMSVDENHNDECVCFHETPRPWLLDPLLATSKDKQGGGAGNGADASSHEQFKAVLTSMVHRTESNEKNPDGSFRVKTRISEQMRTYVMCSNLPKAMIAEAMTSRAFTVELAIKMRRDATLGDKGLDESNQSRDLKGLRRRCDWEFRLLQSLFYHVEKLIFVGALTEPTLTTYMIYVPIFRDVFENQFSINVPIRSLIKMEILVRHMVIRRAIFMLYCTPNAPFRNQTVSLEHLLHLDGLLYDDPEILFWVFDFMRSQYINPYFAVVARALRLFVARSCDTPAICERYRAGYPKKTGSQSLYNAPEPSFKRSFGINSPNEKAPASWATVDAKDDTYDFSRIMLRITRERLCVELEALIGQNEAMHLTRSQIDGVLKAFSTHVVSDHPYLPNPDFDGKVTDKSFFVVQDKTKAKETSIAMTLVDSHNIITFHASILAAMHRDPIDEVVKACCDHTMLQRKMLRGDTIAEDIPHVFGVRKTYAVPGKYHMIPDRNSFSTSVLCMIGKDLDSTVDSKKTPEHEIEAIARHRMKAQSRLSTTLMEKNVDQFSLHRRLEAIHLPVLAEAVLNWRTIDSNICADSSNFVSPKLMINYPDQVDIAESHAEYCSKAHDILAKMPAKDAMETLKGSVSFVMGTCPSVFRKNEVVAFMREHGFDPSISEYQQQKWNDEYEQRRLDIEKSMTQNRAEIEEMRRTFYASRERVLAASRTTKPACGKSPDPEPVKKAARTNEPVVSETSRSAMAADPFEDQYSYADDETDHSLGRF